MGKWGYIIGIVIILLFAVWGFYDIPILEDILDLILGYPFTLIGADPVGIEASLSTGTIFIVVAVVALLIFPTCRSYVWHALMGGSPGGTKGGVVIYDEYEEVTEDELYEEYED